MSKNDEQIKKLLDAITAKRDALGTKPRMVLKTNGILKSNDDTRGININTVNTLDICIHSIAAIIGERSSYMEAAKALEVEYESPKYNGFSIEEWIEDFKLKAKIIKWMAEDKKIKALESKLKDLRSEDLKTADALSDIANSLDL